MDSEGRNQERKNSPKREFSGWISRRRPTRADVLGQNFWLGPRKPWKNEHLDADFHDRNAQMSMTRNFGQVFTSLRLRVVFPHREPGKPPGRKSAKNGEKLQSSPRRSDPPKMGKIAPKKGVKLLRKYNFCNCFVIFPHSQASGRGGKFCNFPIFRRFPARWLPGPSKWKNKS